MSKIRILKTETLASKKYKLETVIYNFIDQHGEEQTAIREVYHRSASAGILLYDPRRKTILLTRQVRIPTYLNGNSSGDLLEACAGMIDEGESPEQCVLREVEEETGYRIKRVKKIAEAYLSPASLIEYMYFFAGRYSPALKVNDQTGKKKDGEDVRTIELTFREARQALSSGKIHDAKTILLLQYAIIHHII